MLEEFIVPFMVSLRVAGFIVTAPLFGSKFIPKKIKAMLSFVIAFIVYLHAESSLPLVIDDIYVTAISNILVGGFIGMMMNIMFSFLNMGGHFVAMGSGLGFATLADPVNGGQTTTLDIFYKITGSLIFVNSGGLIALLIIISNSFNVFPMELGEVITLKKEYILTFFEFALHSALLLAAPMVFTVFLINVCFGVISKASPGLNVFSIGFPTGIWITFLFMTMTIDTLPLFIDRLLDQMPLLLIGENNVR